MRFLLAIPPLLYAKRWTQSKTAHLLNLYSWVRRTCPDVEVLVLDLDREVGSLETESDLDRLRAAFDRYLERTRPDAVGLSCWTSLHYAGTVELARVIKRRFPRAPIIAGGYHATALPEDFADPPGLFDYVVRGEGEVALADLIRGGLEPAPPGQPRVIQGTPLPMEEEELLFDEYPYRRPGAFDLFLSRGCPFPCQFCVEPAIVSMRGSTWRHYSWEKTERLLRSLIEDRGARYFNFGDALFGAKTQFRHAIWELLAGYPDPPSVWCETRVDLLDERDYDYLARLPIQLDVGLDAITKESALRMQKSRNPDAYLAAFRRYLEAMAQRRAYVRAYLIVNYPGETLETLGGTVAEIERTVLDLARRYGQSNLFFGAQSYMLFPGTPDYAARGELERRYGAVFAQDGWWRRAAPRPEVRAGAYLPSRRMLEQGGLGAAASAIDYIRTTCRKHGLPAVHHEYRGDEIPPRRFRGDGFGVLLDGNPNRVDGLRLTLAEPVRLAPGEAGGAGGAGADASAGASAAANASVSASGAGYLFDPVLGYSGKLDADGVALLAGLLAAPTLGEGIAAQPPGEEKRAGTLALQLLDQGFLDLELDAGAGAGAGAGAAAGGDAGAGVGSDADDAAELNLLLSEGGVVARAVDATAGRVLSALARSGYLDGLPFFEAWTGLFVAAPVPPLDAASRAALAASAAAAPIPGPIAPAASPGVYYGVAPDRTWPLLALALEPRWLPEGRRWHRLAALDDGGANVLARVGTGSRIVKARAIRRLVAR